METSDRNIKFLREAGIEAVYPLQTLRTYRDAVKLTPSDVESMTRTSFAEQHAVDAIYFQGALLDPSKGLAENRSRPEASHCGQQSGNALVDTFETWIKISDYRLRETFIFMADLTWVRGCRLLRARCSCGTFKVVSPTSSA